MSKRDQKCVLLREQGKTHMEIAKKLGIHHVTVWKILKNAKNGNVMATKPVTKPARKTTRNKARHIARRPEPNGEYRFVATDLHKRATDLREQADKLSHLALEVDSCKF